MSSPALAGAAYKNVQAISRHCVGPKVIFDLGANVGTFACHFVKRYPNAVVYAFEPVPENYEFLVHHVALYGQGRVHHANIALWDAETTLRLGIPPTRERSNTGLFSAFFNRDAIKVRAFPLDHLHLPRPDLVKIDVEGAESNVIAGGLNTLAAARCVYVERGKRVVEQFPPYHKVERLLLELGLSRVSEGSDEIWVR